MYSQNFKQNIKSEIVEVRYPIEIRKDKCALCKQKGVFICEHDTSVRDRIHSSYIEEGRFYLDPRRRKLNFGNNLDIVEKFDKNKVIPSDNTQNLDEFPFSNDTKTQNIQKLNEINNSSCCIII